MTDRPFDLLFGEFADPRFPAIREAMEESDPWDRDRFLMARPVVELLRDLRPDEGLGGEIGTMVSLVHAGYLYWQEGARVIVVGDRAFAGVMAGPAPSATGPRRMACWVQLPARRIWGEALAGQGAEPLDGCFLVRNEGSLAVTAVLGLHPGRDSITLVDVAGPPVGELARPDGSRLFTPVLEGGERAGLHSIVGMEELLELGWRLEGLVPGAWPTDNPLELA